MAIKFLQCNVNRSQQAQDLLIGYAREVDADLVLSRSRPDVLTL